MRFRLRCHIIKVSLYRVIGKFYHRPERRDHVHLNESGVRVKDFRRFACFGYVPVQRVFKEEKNVSASANFTLNCVDRICYAECTASLPAGTVR